MDSAETPPPELAHGEMTLIEHLTDLRAVLIQSTVAVMAASALAWFVSEAAVDFLINPAVGATEQLVFLTPTGAFMLRVKTAFGLGLFLAAPVVVWRVWSFVLPGLLKKERRLMTPVVLSSVGLFYTGAAFAYFVILPVSIQFLLGFGTEHLQPMLGGEHYFHFVLRLILAFGLVFQFPLVVAVLTYWEILSPDFLQKYWRYGVVVVFVLSALLTPPDVASQVLMAGPVLVLYFVSMGIARAISNSKKREREDQSAPPR